jgi:hypothetical protein
MTFTFQNAPAAELEAPGLTFRPLDFESGTTRVDLLLMLFDRPARLDGHLQYSSDLFDAATALRIGHQLRSLMAARLDSDADRVLARLVQQSAAPVHLICDLTHRLLAASRAREAQFKVPTSRLMGTSLWRYASEDIVRAEAQLADHGWFGPTPPAIEFHTGARESDELAIFACHMRWVRFQLSDGSFVRLVESISKQERPNITHAASPASQSAISASESHWR